MKWPSGPPRKGACAMTTPEHYTITESLHRGCHRDAGSRPAHPRRHPSDHQDAPRRRSSPRSLERLQLQYAIACQLDSPYVLRPSALETHSAQPRLIFEDFGGQPLTSLLGAPLELGRFLDIAIQLAAALADIHRHGVVHKDIKPAQYPDRSTQWRGQAHRLRHRRTAAPRSPAAPASAS